MLFHQKLIKIIKREHATLELCKLLTNFNLQIKTNASQQPRLITKSKS